eukprot:6653315-Pyramimonas_sp.AAC.1
MQIVSPSSSSRPSSDLSMQQPNAPGDTESVYVRSSSVAPLNRELSTENRQQLSKTLEEYE